MTAPLNGTYRWASNAFTQDSLATFYNVQYGVWVDDSRHVRVARRLHGRSFEVAVDLFATVPTAFGSQVTEDSHNVVVAGVDKLGYVHVAGDIHAVPLKYMRTTRPGDLSAWATPGMVGTEENSVTYPAFVRCLSGTLLFFYRDGGSGNGDLLCNVYDAVTQTWTRRAKVFDGKSTNVSAYPLRFALDRNIGRIHLVFMVRTTSDPDTLHDLFYAYTDDEGVTWRRTDGTAYTLPLTEASSDKIVDTADTGAGLLNAGGLDIDSDGHPHAAYNQADGSGVDQIHHLYYDGAAWQDDVVTAFPTAGPSRPAVACFSDGTIWIIYERLAVRALDVTDPANPVTLTLDATDLLAWEPAFDTWALLDRDELHMIRALERSAGPIGGDPADLGAQVDVPVIVLHPGSI